MLNRLTFKRSSLHFIIGLIMMLAFTAQPVFATGVYTGTVFQDYNGNGVQDLASTAAASGSGTFRTAIDPGIQGVTVTLYDAAGNPAGTAATDSNGDYTINSTGTGPYRLEFTGYESLGYTSGPQGADNLTSVQFVDDGGDVRNFGVEIGGDYCQDNPLLVTPCYIFGDQSVATPVLVSFPYGAGDEFTGATAALGTIDQPAGHTIAIPANQIGATFGLGYDRIDADIYAAAFMKRHSDYGPGGIGAIYRIDLANSGGAVNGVSTFFDMNSLGAPLPAGTNYRDDADFTDLFSDTLDPGGGGTDNTGWDAVGKIGLGDLEIDNDGEFMYVIALGDRMLYRLPLNTPPNAGNIISADLVSGVTCPGGDDNVRPMALGYGNWNGAETLILGVTCTAESTQDTGDLEIQLFTVDLNTLALSAIPGGTIPLNYPRGSANDTAPDATWNPWSTTYMSVGSDPETPSYPQPMITQIAIDGDDFIIGIRDRLGDQVGNETPSEPGETDLRRGITAGDTLRMCFNGASLVLETGGLCDGQGSGVTDATVGDSQGPGNGEFYAGDEYEVFYAGTTLPGQSSEDRHDEVSQGGIFQIPGFPDVAITMFDPAYADIDADGFDTGGLRWLDNAGLFTAGAVTGQVRRSYQLYGQDASNFGKANGLGDLVALCEAAPIEVGNRIWEDLDSDGVQDPGEPGIPGVTVRLFDASNTEIGIAVTDADGNYFFSNGAGTSTQSAIYNVSGLTPNTTGFEIRVDLGQSALAGFSLTLANNDQDIRDSDATDISNVATIPFDTGAAGANDHTLDAGFVLGDEPPPPGGSDGGGGDDDDDGPGDQPDSPDAAPPEEPGLPTTLPGTGGGAPPFIVTLPAVLAALATLLGLGLWRKAHQRR